MSKQWKLIAGWAALGLLVAAFFFIVVGILGDNDDTVITAMLVSCPPSLLSIYLSDAMRDRNSFYVVCSFIGFLNAGLYAVVGAAIAGQLWEPD